MLKQETAGHAAAHNTSPVKSAFALPALSEDYVNEDEDNSTEAAPGNETQNLYIIKSVVYEIGILTDGDDEDSSNETHEQVDLSFFDPNYNGSIIDLSNIPLPIQTNVSGVAITGILPTDLGSISLNDDGTASYNGTAFPILPNKQVRITHNISTVSKDKSSSILSELPKILGLDDLIKTNSTKTEGENEEVTTETDKNLKVEGLSERDKQTS
ncbi:hypothetical protein NQ317_019934 [Molorchus minor]|uniref:Uncharacterized protein n=1 Tax=Molorchus minor TaxID=1323400 RepID=A0ABQ9K7Q5_9CUCU|nr:hypothetical protein NQ317_019934 [Molorchus minor]